MNKVFYAGTLSSTHQVNLALFKVKQGNRTLTEYYEGISALIACAKARNLTIEESTLVAAYMQGLNKVYNDKKADVDCEMQEGKIYSLYEIHTLFHTWALARSIELSESQQRLRAQESIGAVHMLHQALWIERANESVCGTHT